MATIKTKKIRKRILLIPGIVIFFLYVFIAARPVPEETVLVPRWITSFESGFPINLGSGANFGETIPFHAGNRFGYVGDDGRFLLNRALDNNYLSISPEAWSLYAPVPASADIVSPEGRVLFTVNDPHGYPLFLDGKTFIVGSEQNSITGLDDRGAVRWTYDFPAPLTCVDAAAGFLLAGTLDGSVELLDSGGQRVYSFEPGGSRLSAVFGCALSGDASRIAVISGINDQRFLLLEKSGDSFRVVYHEFLNEGYRRAVHVTFIDNGNKAAFEREGGIGIYDIPSRTCVSLPLDGEIIAMDQGADDYLFVVTAEGSRKRLVAIRLPGVVLFDAPFRSEAVYLQRRDSHVYLAADNSVISFEVGSQ